MASAQQKFWKLAIDSRLLTLAECQQLHADFSEVSTAEPEDAAALARWLVSVDVLTKYQARVLLAGRAGPFIVGDYTIVERWGEGQTKGLYEAVCQPTGERVVLLVVPRSAAEDRAKLQDAGRKLQKVVASPDVRLLREMSFAVDGSLCYGSLAEYIAEEPPRAAEFSADDQNAAEPEPAVAAWVPPVIPSRSRKKQRSLGSTLVGWGVTVVLLSGLGGGAWMLLAPAGGAGSGGQDDPMETTGETDVVQHPPDESPKTDSGPTEEQFALGVESSGSHAEPTVQLVPDDGQTLWASPTSGPPIDSKYLPAATETIVLLRPAEIVASAEGTKMIEALGPAGEAAMTSIQAITLCTPAEIEQLKICIAPAETGPPRVLLAMRLADGVTTEAWNARLVKPTRSQHAGQTYLESGGRAYWLPESEGGRLVVIATDTEIDELVDQSAPRLTKEMERLLSSTDVSRHFTLLVEPNSVFEGAQTIFPGALARLADPLRLFLGPGVQGAMLSGYIGDDLFLELRAYAHADVDPRQLSAHYRSELGALPQQFETYLSSLDLQPYGRAILVRFPRMLDQLYRYSRSGAEHRQAVVRCYLPAAAGQNLLLGTELALAETPRVGDKEPKEKGAKSVDVAAALAKRTSLSFPRDTLEKSLEMLSKDIGVEIIIMGSDLQLDGITKNQSFSLDERDQPAGEILLKILKLANSDGKLVYVIKPKSAGGPPALFVTTRAAVKKRGESLPAVFEKK